MTIHHPLVKAINRFIGEQEIRLAPVAALSLKDLPAKLGDYFFFIYLLEESSLKRSLRMIPIMVNIDDRNVTKFLDDASDVQEARRRLVSDVAGLGPKQASLFLRNAGYATHVAVLDVHILSYMSWAGLTETPVKSVSSVRRYESLEDTFVEHACSFGYPPDLFDVAVWVAVQVAKEEYRTRG